MEKLNFVQQKMIILYFLMKKIYYIQLKFQIYQKINTNSKPSSQKSIILNIILIFMMRIYLLFLNFVHLSFLKITK